jgi:ribonuclease P protein component
MGPDLDLVARRRTLSLFMVDSVGNIGHIDDQNSSSRDRFVFRRRHRLSSSAHFQAVFDAKLKKSKGPMTVFLLPTELDEHRLGLSIGRRAGNAVVRGRLKRMVREAFRHSRSELPKPGVSSHGSLVEMDRVEMDRVEMDRGEMDTGAIGAYDIVVTMRKHDPLTLDEYTRCFVEAVESAHRTHLKRMSK